MGPVPQRIDRRNDLHGIRIDDRDGARLHVGGVDPTARLRAESQARHRKDQADVYDNRLDRTDFPHSWLHLRPFARHSPQGRYTFSRVISHLLPPLSRTARIVCPSSFAHRGMSSADFAESTVTASRPPACSFPISFL